MQSLNKPSLVERLLVLGNREGLCSNHSGYQVLGFGGRMSLSLKPLECLASGSRSAITNLVVKHLQKGGS